jgi:DNA-binding CsgD family transcriptional regulator
MFQKMKTMSNSNNVVFTKRELEILKMFRAGKTSRECAEELHVSYFTVETHRKNIHHKLGTHKLINAVNTLEKIRLNDIHEI